MYIFKNAFRSLVRAKGRNLLIALIVLVLSVSSCIGLSIKQANNTLKDEYANDREITATLTAATRGPNAQGVSLDTLKKYSDDKVVKAFSYSASLYFSAGEGIEPLDVSGSFGANRDFRDKYGDIENGQKITSSTSSSTTSTEDTAATDNGIIKLANKSSATVLLLNNEASQESSLEDSVSSKTDSEDATNGDNSVSSEITSDTESNTSSKKTTTNEGQPTPPNQNNTSSLEAQTPPQQNENGNENGTQNQNAPDGFSDFSNGNGATASEGGNTEGSKMPTPPTNEDGTNTAPPEASGESGRGGKTFITNHNIVNNQYFFNMASMNDFTVVGYSDNSAMPDYVSELHVLDVEDDSLNCVISKALAEENELETGDKFTLSNPDNEDESYKFTIIGICDTSTDTEATDTSSNASYTDNFIHISGAAVENIVSKSAKTNAVTQDDEDKSARFTPTYSGVYTFKNLTDYETLTKTVSEDNYTLVSEDVENYEKSVEQLDTLGGYATYFLIVIFIIGAIVLVIINLFSIRDRKYEIGVLTAIGMKKHKVAMQFIIELFCITFTALIIGSGIGAVSSVPVTNSLLTTINSKDTAVVEQGEMSSMPENFEPGNMPSDRGEMGENGMTPPTDRGEFSGFRGFMDNTNNYIASVSSATDLTVIGQMILVGLGLTLISALSAVLFVMRYEPLKILSNRE